MIEEKFEKIYADLDDILVQLSAIEAEEGESTKIEDCRAAVDILATQIEVLRRGEKAKRVVERADMEKE
jgi:hypothetical protein